jgi:hypothetical protein
MIKNKLNYVQLLAQRKVTVLLVLFCEKQSWFKNILTTGIDLSIKLNWNFEYRSIIIDSYIHIMIRCDKILQNQTQTILRSRNKLRLRLRFKIFPCWEISLSSELRHDWNSSAFQSDSSNSCRKGRTRRSDSLNRHYDDVACGLQTRFYDGKSHIWTRTGISKSIPNEDK